MMRGGAVRAPPHPQRASRIVTTAAPPAATMKKGAPAPALRPFFPGSLDLETHTYSKTTTLTTTAVPLDTYYVKTNGILADLHLSVTMNATPNAGATVAYNEDAPWNSIALFTLSDTGGQPILGPMTGWELKTFIKYGGFSFSDDPQDSQSYAATTGATTAGGFFKFILHVPIQFVKREPLGALPNTNNQTVFAVDITLNTLANIYSTSPTGTPSLTLVISQDSYRQSSGMDAQKNPTVTTPPGFGATQYMRRNTINLAAGAVQQELNQPEGSFRTITFVLRDSNNSRAQGESDFPNPLRVHFNNDVPYDRLTALWRRKIEKDYGYKATIATAGGQDNGTFPLHWIGDHELKAGSEDRYRYLSAAAADTIEFEGIIGGSGTHLLTTMYNYVRPAGGNIKALTAR